jgi:hypothetical protein
MLKVLAIFILSLFVFRMQTDTQSNQTQHKPKDSKPSFPVAPVIPHQTTSQTGQPAHQEHIDADVRVISTPAKDSYDKAAFWATIALVVAGFVGIGVAVLTLRTIKRQADTFVSKERARITVDIGPLNPSDTNPFGISYDKSPMPPGKFGTHDVDLQISNSGETNAFIRVAFCKACIKPTNWNPRKEITTSQIPLPKVMHPHEKAFRHKSRIETGHILVPEVDKDMTQSIADGFHGIFVIGHIEFGDVFDNRWTVKFCRKWGARWFGGGWEGASSWYDFEAQTRGGIPMNGEFRVKNISALRLALQNLRRKKSDVPEIKIT